MMLHPVIGAELLSADLFCEEIVRAVRHHHERWDGNGYPDGLRGGEIPMAARIIALADVYDAMIINRPYRRALTKKEAATEIFHCAWNSVCPGVGRCVCHIGLGLILQWYLKSYFLWPELLRMGCRRPLSLMTHSSPTRLGF